MSRVPSNPALEQAPRIAPRRHRRTAVAGCLGLTLVLVLASCQDDGEPTAPVSAETADAGHRLTPAALQVLMTDPGRRWFLTHTHGSVAPAGARAGAAVAPAPEAVDVAISQPKPLV